jgi:hypothetical protein
MKLFIILAFLAVANAQNSGNDTNGHEAEEVMAMLAFCVCDSNTNHALEVSEFNNPICTEVTEAFFGMNAKDMVDFHKAADSDANDLLTPTEIENFFQTMAVDRRLARNGEFSVEAQIHLVGCACDNDGSDGVSMDELKGELCSVVVEHLFHGEQMPEDQMQDIFNLMDTNGDGQIDGNEAYNAATQFETTGK